MIKEGQDLDMMIKLVTIGESGVGKTNIISRFVKDEFSENLVATVGMDFYTKNITVAQKKVNLQVWDTAGQERMRAIASAYYREANGVLLVFDITDKESFARVPFWVKEIRDNGNENVKIILLGNKIDLEAERQVSVEEGKLFAAQRGYYYMEISAKTNEKNCISAAFEELLKGIVESLKPDDLTRLQQNSHIRKNFQVELDVAKQQDGIKSKRKCCQYL